MSATTLRQQPSPRPLPPQRPPTSFDFCYFSASQRLCGEEELSSPMSANPTNQTLPPGPTSSPRNITRASPPCSSSTATCAIWPPRANGEFVPLSQFLREALFGAPRPGPPLRPRRRPHLLHSRHEGRLRPRPLGLRQLPRHQLLERPAAQSRWRPQHPRQLPAPAHSRQEEDRRGHRFRRDHRARRRHLRHAGRRPQLAGDPQALGAEPRRSSRPTSPSA
jgi:hypothetical protein